MAFEEQLPMPCRRCGAPMRPIDDFTIACDYCGGREPLPPHAAERVAVLRRRLAELEAAHRRLERTAVELARRFEGQRDVWLSGTLKAALGPLAIIVGLVALPAATKGDFDLASLAMPIALLLQLVLVVGGMIFGRAMFSRAYRRNVRPRLLARAPLTPQAPLRCRVCGGALPAERTALIACRFCHATNLVTDEVARERERALRIEADGYRSRAANAVVTVPFEHASFSSTGIVVGNVVGLVLGSAVLWSVIALMH